MKSVELEQKQINCMDAYFLKDDVRLEYREYCKACDNRYIRYELKDQNESLHDKYEILRNIAKGRVSQINDKNMFHQMRMFADDLAYNCDIELEIQGFKNFYTLPIYKNLQAVARRRGQFAEFLAFIAKEENKEHSCNSEITPIE